MSPSEFMLYATPVILLISQELRAYFAKRDIKRITDQQTDAINAAGKERADVLQTTTIDTASKLAVHTSEKANALGEELGEIHELVNGNTTALRNRIAELEKQITQRDAQTLMDAQTAALNLAGDQRSTLVQSTVVDSSAALKAQIHDLEAQLKAPKQKP